MSVRLSAGQLDLSVVPIRYLHAGLSIDLLAYLFVCLPACCSVCPSFHRPVVHIGLHAGLSIGLLRIYLSACLPVCLPACCSVCPFVIPACCTYHLAGFYLPAWCVFFCSSVCLPIVPWHTERHSCWSFCLFSFCLFSLYLPACLPRHLYLSTCVSHYLLCLWVCLFVAGPFVYLPGCLHTSSFSLFVYFVCLHTYLCAYISVHICLPTC